MERGVKMDNLMLNNKIYLEGKIVSNWNSVMKCMEKDFIHFSWKLLD